MEQVPDGPGRGLSHRTWFLIVIVFAASAGTYFVIPFLAIHLSRQGHFSAALIGLLLALSLVTSRGLPVIAGPLSDRIGPRRALTLGLLLVGAAYAGLALIQGFSGYAALLVLMGAGVALFQPSSKTLLGLGVPAPSRARIYAWRSVAYNAGAALGAGVGSALLPFFGRAHLFLTAGVLYGLLVCAMPWTPSVPRISRPAGGPPLHDLLEGLRDSRLVGLTALAGGFWLLYAQLGLTFPLSLATIGLERLIGPTLALNALLVIAFQLPLSSLCDRHRLSPGARLAGGFAATGVGLGCLALLDHGWLLLVVFVALYSLGEMLVAPTLDAVVSLIAPEHAMGAYFGIASLGWAAGGLSGNLLGGQAVDLGAAIHLSGLPWMACLTIGLLLSIVTWLTLGRQQFSSPTSSNPSRLPIT